MAAKKATKSPKTKAKHEKGESSADETKENFAKKFGKKSKKK